MTVAEGAMSIRRFFSLPLLEDSVRFLPPVEPVTLYNDASRARR
jgi:hypothetical protein